MSKQKAAIYCMVVGGIGLIVVLFASYFLDDKHVSPFYWLRFEFSPSIKKIISLDHGEKDKPFVIYSFQKGNSGVFVDVELYAGTNSVVRLGGDETSFLGFKDVDNDGQLELLFTSSSTYGTGRSVWKYDGERWRQITITRSALRILWFAELLFFGPMMVFFAVILLLAGVLNSYRGKARCKC